MIGANKQVSVARIRAGEMSDGVDRVATEEPLEVRLHGQPFAVIMRTPGGDRELAAGFLLSEGVIQGADDLGSIAHCTDPSPHHSVTPSLPHPITPSSHHPITPSSPHNVVNVTLVGRAFDALDRVMAERRLVTGNSSCGMCGRLTIESLQARVAPITSPFRMWRDVVLACPSALRARQKTFDETGGLHAAGLFHAEGGIEALAEDVGRHNAVDKVIGRMILGERLPLRDVMLFVSGRTSFEIVQKALLAGIPIVGAVSAPTSLAVELADASGITLMGFVRDSGLNIYTHSERIA